MFRKPVSPAMVPQLRLMIGRFLAIINEAQPIPASAHWFVKEISKLQALTPTKAIAQHLQQSASLVEQAFRSASHQEVNDALWKAIFHLQTLVGNSKTGMIVDDPQWIGKQVVSREYQEGKEIIYGLIESTLVFLNEKEVFDSWVVKVKPGFHIDAASSAFVLYDGPLFQPGEQVLYQKEGKYHAATILGPGFGLRGCFGFNIVIHRGGTEDYRYAVSVADLSSVE